MSAAYPGRRPETVRAQGKIGGYFELELGSGRGIHSDGLQLNSARNCLKCLLACRSVKHVYMPRYTCAAILEPLEQLELSYSFYSIDDRLEIADSIELGPDEWILYTNYFGIKSQYASSLPVTYGSNLVLDASQALFFTPPADVPTFYSPRKFVGVPDGGILCSASGSDRDWDFDTSCGRFEHLIKRIDFGPEHGYSDFRTNDASLADQPIRAMSRLTRRLLGSIDFEAVRAKRAENYGTLHHALAQSNRLALPMVADGPMVYPYWTTDTTLRQRLLAEGIFVATYWPGVFERCGQGGLEQELVSKLIPLPLDQRYGPQEMRRIIEVVNG